MTRASLLQNKGPGAIVGWLSLFVFLLMQALYWGWNLGCFALSDPDSCWLVATGQSILRQGISVLQADQFAWTLKSIHPGAYVLYQWLAEVFFALIHQAAGNNGLVYLAAIISFISFVALPLISSRHMQARFVPTVFVTMLTFSAGLYHLPLRPEIFSYLLLSVLVSLSIRCGINIRAQALHYCMIFVIFALWANCHTGFVIGLVYLLLLALWTAVYDRTKLTRRALALLVAGLATLIQPYGLGLWTYLPHLFFADINKLNVELQPLMFTELLSVDFWPFTILILLSLVYAIRQIGATKTDSTKTVLLRTQLILTLLLLIAAFSCRRLVPFFALAAEYFLILALPTAGSKLSWRYMSYWLALPLTLIVAAAGIACHVLNVELPSSTGGFVAPRGALAYLGQNRPPGNCYNDAQYGDLMIYQFGKRADVFIDTRFDLYGDKLTSDYFKIANVRDNWLELLDEYKIDWLFVMSDYQAVRELKARGWSMLYNDDVSVILQRPDKRQSHE